MYCGPIVDIHVGTARRIAVSLRTNAALLHALLVLRATPNSERAVAAVLELRDLRVLLASWQLFDEMTAEAGGSNAWLRRHAGRPTIEAARAALFGDLAPPDPDDRRAR